MGPNTFWHRGTGASACLTDLPEISTAKNRHRGYVQAFRLARLRPPVRLRSPACEVRPRPGGRPPAARPRPAADGDLRRAPRPRTRHRPGVAPTRAQPLGGGRRVRRLPPRGPAEPRPHGHPPGRRPDRTPHRRAPARPDRRRHLTAAARGHRAHPGRPRLGRDPARLTPLDPPLPPPLPRLLAHQPRRDPHVGPPRWPVRKKSGTTRRRVWDLNPREVSLWSLSRRLH